MQLKKGTVLDVCFVMDCCRGFVKVFVVIVNGWFRCGFLLLMKKFLLVMKKFLPSVLACLVHSKIPASHMIVSLCVSGDIHVFHQRLSFYCYE